jgi:hypothetical protein
MTPRLCCEAFDMVPDMTQLLARSGNLFVEKMPRIAVARLSRRMSVMHGRSGLTRSDVDVLPYLTRDIALSRDTSAGRFEAISA